MNDIGSVEIAAGLAGSLTVGTLIFLILQNVKAFAPNLNGRNAETVLLLISALVAAAAFITADVNWYDAQTIIAFIVATLSASVLARSTYAQLFKVSVTGSPPSSEATVPPEAVIDPQAADPYDALPDDRKPIAATITTRSRGTRRTAIDTSE